MGVLHDTHNILKNMAEEVSVSYCIPKMHYSPIYQLEHLNTCTGTETCMFSVKGKEEHYHEGTVILTSKASAFLTNIFKLVPDNVLREFEHYTLKNAEGALTVCLCLCEALTSIC